MAISWESGTEFHGCVFPFLLWANRGMRGPGFSSRSTTVPEGCPNSDLMKKFDVHL